VEGVCGWTRKGGAGIRTGPDGDASVYALSGNGLPMADIRQIVLEGVAYDLFVVLSCRICLAEGRINSM